jgi:glycosyltransferase involved in cell wall biosynthesis
VAATIETPLVSIGLPVYNEERFIDATLASLRQQDYPHIEILVSDNASTDRTVEICKRHAAEDIRIRIKVQTSNSGVTPNFENALAMANGRYFMWAAGHDLWTPNFVSECVALLERQPGACLAFGSSRWITGDGEPLPIESGWTDTRGMSAVARAFTIFWGNMHPVVGMIRTADLRACLPLHQLAGGDLVLLMQLALRGHFVHATRAEWCRREFRMEKSHSEKLKRYAGASTRIVRSPLGKLFPMLELPAALVKVLMKSNLPASDKVLALATLAPSLPLRYLVGKRGQA